MQFDNICVNNRSSFRQNGHKFEMTNSFQKVSAKMTDKMKQVFSY